jgi:ADP-ribose pyrophosphatase
MEPSKFPQIIQSEPKYQFRVFSVVEQKLQFPDGTTSGHLTLQHPGAVVVLAKTANQQLVFIRQYRPSIQAEILELPAGTLGVNERPIDCAHRELAEETGFGANSMIEVGTLYPTPGFCSEIQYLFFAQDLYPHQLPKDQDEVIETELLTLDQVDELIKTEGLIDAKSIALIYKAKIKGLL